MFREAIEQIISKRMSTDANYDFKIQECWQEEIKLMTEHMEETIQYITHEASEDSLAWLSEVFDDVVCVSPNPQFIQAITERYKRMQDADAKHAVKVSLESADIL